MVEIFKGFFVQQQKIPPSFPTFLGAYWAYFPSRSCPFAAAAVTLFATFFASPPDLLPPFASEAKVDSFCACTLRRSSFVKLARRVSVLLQIGNMRKHTQAIVVRAGFRRGWVAIWGSTRGRHTSHCWQFFEIWRTSVGNKHTAHCKSSWPLRGVLGALENIFCQIFLLTSLI